MSNAKTRWLVTVCILSMFTATAHAQASSDAKPQPTPTPSLEKRFLVNILSDQKAIWTAPLRLRRGDGKWLFPLGAATSILLATDRRSSGELLEPGDHRTRLRISHDVSYLGSGLVTGGVAASFYLVGRVSGNKRARETGLLTAEALIDSAIVVTALKAVSQRPRPTVDHASGEFLDGGNSFPSGHAISAWTLATVVDQEYGRHRPLVRISAYGIATAVSLSRYTGTNHFLSDVLIGSALGYGMGRYVYHQHHDRSLDADDGTRKKKTLLQSKFFPRLAPAYGRQGHVVGVRASWGG